MTAPTISRLHVAALVAILAVFTAAPTASAFFFSCPDATGPDVIVGEVANTPTNPPHITNYASSGGIEALSVSTLSCNMGNQRLKWISSTPEHPVIGQNVFRLKTVAGSTRFEQVGQSWLKHGFFALSETLCCTCNDPTNGTELGVGCSDPYNSSRNGGQSLAGPKWQVNATTGVHIHPLANPPWSGSVARRLQIKISDLEVSVGTGSTLYFVEAQYIAADDSAAGNKNNNASFRTLLVTGSGTAWTFSVSPTFPTLRGNPAVFAWKNNDPAVTITAVDTPEDFNTDPDLMVGRVYVAARATNLGGGTYHYEYAVQNLNSDRSIGSFAVPLSPFTSVKNIGFHDVDYANGDGIGNVSVEGSDWPGLISRGEVRWETLPFTTNPNSNAIRWGTLYNFRFDCDQPPITGNVTLGQYKSPNNFTVTTVIPRLITDSGSE